MYVTTCVSSFTCCRACASRAIGRAPSSLGSHPRVRSAPQSSSVAATSACKTQPHPSQPLASPSALAVALVAAAAAAAATAVQIGMGCVRIIGDASLASLNQLHGLLPPPGDIHVHRSLESLEELAVADAWHIARPELRHLVRPDHLHLVLRPTSKAVCGGQCSHKVSPCGRVVRTSLRQRARTCAESSLTKEPEIISGTPNCFVTACRHTH